MTKNWRFLYKVIMKIAQRQAIRQGRIGHTWEIVTNLYLRLQVNTGIIATLLHHYTVNETGVFKTTKIYYNHEKKSITSLQSPNIPKSVPLALEIDIFSRDSGI